jgi:hypothetical protein
MTLGRYQLMRGLGRRGSFATNRYHAPLSDTTRRRKLAREKDSGLSEKGS